jgi:cytochrome bd-type quinol oxidase subunit 2
LEGTEENMTELTSEEREKIFLEEKARHEARQQIQSESQNIAVGGMIIFIGGLLIIIGLALPWATAGAMSVDGFRKIGGFATVILFIGIVDAIAGVTIFLSRDNPKRQKPKFLSYTIAGGGLVLAVKLVRIYPFLRDNVSSINVFGAGGQIGSGFWLTCIGVLLVIIGSPFIHPRKQKK